MQNATILIKGPKRHEVFKELLINFNKPNVKINLIITGEEQTAFIFSPEMALEVKTQIL